MNLNKDPESWARVESAAVLSGSAAQSRNVLDMALEDIKALGKCREALVWYSNPRNWNRDDDAGRCWRQSAAMEDAGKRARAALGIGTE